VSVTRAQLARIARSLEAIRLSRPPVFQVVEQEDGETVAEFKARADAAIHASSERRLFLLIAANETFDQAWGNEAGRPEGLRPRPNAPPSFAVSAGSQPASPRGSRRQ
jgi:hypothetical protein